MRALLLAAGRGARLKPLTNIWPKCLMPISGRPLLEYWLSMICGHDFGTVLVNVHHQKNELEKFLSRNRFTNWVTGIYEPQLLGTAGTLFHCLEQLEGETVLVAHADNWCRCDFSAFLNYHKYHRPEGTVLTAMTFRTTTPESCGIVELDQNGVIRKIYEKVSDPPGNLANGAVYLIEPEVLQWLKDNPLKRDFSTDVLPYYVGRIATWENTGIHRDIGVAETLLSAQSDPVPELFWPAKDEWQLEFEQHPIHGMLESLSK